MRVIEPGHLYVVDLCDTDGLVSGYRRFFKRVGPEYPGNQPPAYGGTNCQEEIRVLIDRVKYLDGQAKHHRNQIILHHLRGSLWEFELRHAELRREIEMFTHRAKAWVAANSSLWSGDRPEEPELIPTCSTCGHVLCPSQHRSKQL